MNTYREIVKSDGFRVFYFICSLLVVFTLTNLERQITIEQKENVIESHTEKTTAIVEEIIEEEPTTELEIVETTTERVNENPNYIGRFWCTSYCPCAICCSSYAYNRPVDENGNKIVIGASGQELIPSYSVAVDPSIIPYGTVIVIDGQEYIAADTGVYGYRLDFYYATHEEALSHGNHWAEVYRK